jgi:rod shape-determining protein MreD
MRSLLAGPIQMLSVAVLTFLAVLPWGLPAELRFLPPLFPFMAIHYWALAPVLRLPDWAVFGSGLALDVLTYGPLGYWPLVFLVGYALTQPARKLAGAGAVARFLLFAAILTTVMAFAFLLCSLYFGQLAEFRPMLVATALAVGLYPVVTLFLAGLDWSEPAPSAGEYDHVRR